jgi:low affinity Fe/Cu permease
MNANDLFRRFAIRVSQIAGTPHAFFVALTIIIIWALSGPTFGFSNTWQLFINTGTTIATLLMVFLIQNTQNRDSKAIHIKLDELIKAIRGARDTLVNLEEMPDDEIEVLHQEFQKLHKKYTSELIKRGKITKRIDKKTLDVIK